MLAPMQELASSHAGACWFSCFSMLAPMQKYAVPMEEYVYRFLSSSSRSSFYKQSMLAYHIKNSGIYWVHVSTSMMVLMQDSACSTNIKKYVSLTYEDILIYLQ